MDITAFDLAQRFIGMKEVQGVSSNPQILAMLRLDDNWPENDEVPWCSAFVNYIAWLLRLPRSHSLAARSWLTVGTPLLLSEAKVGFDVIVLSRDQVTPPGPAVLNAPGHVGFFAGLTEPDRIQVLGGNQGNSVSVAPFWTSRLLGVRRLG